MNSLRNSLFWTPIWTVHFYLFSMVLNTSITIYLITITLSRWIIKPISHRLHYIIWENLMYVGFNNLFYIFFVWTPSTVRVHMEWSVHQNHIGREKSLFVQNHFMCVDFLFLFRLMHGYKALGTIKPCVRVGASKAPLFGQFLLTLQPIVLSRYFSQDEARIKERCRFFNRLKGLYTLLLFAEGTRFTVQKRDASNQFARARGLKELEHHLIPRTKGFVTLIKELRSSIEAVYSFEVVTEQAWTIGTSVLGHPLAVDIYIKRFGADQLPDNDKLKDFLFKMYEEKDYIKREVLKGNDRFDEAFFENAVVLPIFTEKLQITLLMFIEMLILGLMLYYFGTWFRIIVCTLNFFALILVIIMLENPNTNKNVNIYNVMLRFSESSHFHLYDVQPI